MKSLECVQEHMPAGREREHIYTHSGIRMNNTTSPAEQQHSSDQSQPVRFPVSFSALTDIANETTLKPKVLFIRGCPGNPLFNDLNCNLSRRRVRNQTFGVETSTTAFFWLVRKRAAPEELHPSQGHHHHHKNVRLAGLHEACTCRCAGAHPWTVDHLSGQVNHKQGGPEREQR